MSTTMDDFRAEVHGLLSAHWPRRREADEFQWGVGPDRVSILGDRSPEAELAELERARRWQATKFDAGFGWLPGPVRYGGRGLTAAHEATFRGLEAGYDVPDPIFFNLGRGSVGPAILAEGSSALRDQVLVGLYRGDLVACQLFSEPGAGSDLASVATKAVRDGDGWVLTGQKVWTSGAHYSDIGLALTRTDTSAPNRAALTVFVVDLHAEGVEVRPIRQMSGSAHFSEVFLDGVRVPDTHRVGAVGAGWGVAMTALANERAALGAASVNAPLGHVAVERLVALAVHSGRAGDPTVRRLVAEVHMLSEIADLTTSRMMDAAAPGAPPGPEMSACKLLRTELIQRTSELVVEILGPALVADTGAWGTYGWGPYVLEAPGVRIGGGTDNIQRNILAERVLGLPREARAR